jgi:hypothetical protein
LYVCHVKQHKQLKKMETTVNGQTTPKIQGNKKQGANKVSEAKPAPIVSKEQLKESKAAMRTECRTLAFALKLIIEAKGVDANLSRIAAKARKEPELYAKIEAGCKRTKTGNFSPSLTIEFIAKVANGKA